MKKISRKDGIVTKYFDQSKLCGARRLLTEFPDERWKWGTIESVKEIRKTGTVDRHQAAADRVRCVSNRREHRVVRGLCAQSRGPIDP